MTTAQTTPGWYPDPLSRHELRYHDGANWTDDVSTSGVQSRDAVADTAVAAAAPAATVTLVPGLAEPKRRQMAFTMLGCAGVMLLAVFLPWASGNAGSINGLDIGVGYLTGLCAIGLAAYGYNSLSAPVVRYHPGALTAIILGFFAAALVQEGVETLNSATLGVGDVEAGTGLYLTMLAPLVAIWPLVVFWKDFRVQRQHRRYVAAGLA